MTLLDLVRQAETLGLKLEPRGDGKLRVTPAQRCPPEFAQLLRDHKEPLLAWLKQPPCPGWQSAPPVHVPLNPLPPRPTPTNARLIMDFIVRQIGNEPNALCEWCLRRELAYWETYRWPDQICSYAAARDAACWQLGRGEEATRELLEAFEEVGRTHSDSP